MASTETQSLKIIWENKGKASLLKIAKELKISTNYGHLICRDLLKDKFVEFFEGQYKITDLGKEELEKLGVIEKVSKVIKLQKSKKKPVGVEREETIAKKEVRKATITTLSNLAPKLIEALKKKGFKTLEDIATTSVSRLEEIIEGLKLQKAAEMINEARAKLKKEGKEHLWENIEKYVS